MNKITLGLKTASAKAIAFALLTASLLASQVALAAVHNISLTAEVLPNGQYGYKRGDKAVIPGPTLFVKQGDTVIVTVTKHR
jgi:FtsP/CotA-like multicopper oxidase with cupredoxin domain